MTSRGKSLTPLHFTSSISSDPAPGRLFTSPFNKIDISCSDTTHRYHGRYDRERQEEGCRHDSSGLFLLSKVDPDEGRRRGGRGESYQRWASSCTNGSDEGRAGQDRQGAITKQGKRWLVMKRDGLSRSTALGAGSVVSTSEPRRP
jgi:hypothetical protein